MIKLYTILFSRDSKTKKVRHPHQHPHQNKTKVFGVESEILIKYKRIKWTPRVKASLLFSQGDKITAANHQLIPKTKLLVITGHLRRFFFISEKR